VHFGTDGWRGVIADDFTVANVRLVARAIASYVLEHEDSSRPLVLGYDTRFGSERFARVAAEELARAGLRVLLSADHCSTPAVSYAVWHFQAAGGVVITASHNPWQWNGVKFKARYGGSASPKIVARIEEALQREPPQRAGGEVSEADFRAPYLERLAQQVDLAKIAAAGFRFAVDPMFGAGRGYLPALFDKPGIACQEIHAHRDPLFGGLNPEPIEPHIEELRRAVRGGGFAAGFALDGDADRLGAVDAGGAFVDSHRIFSILLEYLVDVRGWRGEVAKTFSTTKMVDRIARRHGLLLHETPIGFKYICDLMLERDILIGGEESGGIGIKGHLPERDAVLNSLLLAEVMAHHRRTLGDLVADLHARYGPLHYNRVDLHLPVGQKERAMDLLTRQRPARIAGFPVSHVEDLDGIKFLLEPNAWVLVRASGTEPLLRTYAEAPSPEAVEAILDEIREIVRQGAVPPPAA
jgi:phosphomannomutase